MGDREGMIFRNDDSTKRIQGHRNSTKPEIVRLREKLTKACIRGKSRKVESLLTKIIDMKEQIDPSASYENCLYRAVQNNHRNTVKAFLDIKDDSDGHKFRTYIEPLFLTGINKTDGYNQGNIVGVDTYPEEVITHPPEVTIPPSEGTISSAEVTIHPAEVTTAAEQEEEKKNKAKKLTRKRTIKAEQKKTDSPDVLVEMIKKMPDLTITLLNKYFKKVSNESEAQPARVSNYFQGNNTQAGVGDVIINMPNSEDVCPVKPDPPSEVEIEKETKYECDYKLLTNYTHPYPESKKNWSTYNKSQRNYALLAAHEADDLSVLRHPLVASLLVFKWKKACRLYYAIMCWYILYTAIFTLYVLAYNKDQFTWYAREASTTTTSELLHNTDSSTHSYIYPPHYGVENPGGGSEDHFEDSPEDSSEDDGPTYKSDNTAHAVYCLVLCIMSVIGVLIEVVQWYLMRKLYFSQNIGELTLTLLNWVMYITTFLFAVPFYGVRLQLQWKMGVFIMFSSWFLTLLHHPVFGTYLTVMLDVIKETMRFTILYIMFLISFGISFFALLRNQGAFHSLTSSFRRTWTMMIGDIGYNDIYHPDDEDEMPTNKGALIVLFYIFLFISIILMNMWTGFVINRMSEIEQKNPMKRHIIQLRFIIKLESFLPTVLSKYFILHCDSLDRKTNTNNNEDDSYPESTSTFKIIEKRFFMTNTLSAQLAYLWRILIGDTVVNAFKHEVEFENYDYEDNRDVLDNMEEHFDDLEEKTEDKLQKILTKLDSMCNMQAHESEA